ncbi:hypothetical protein COC42_05185 [Sphingomonas spermidinifaciens]|uniref:Argininosuccinate lyase n=1 Tax=Sphingomonas spermidinifaciens TaxID=1141889 RepID=A0A2A4B745_9SPHN|nr:hypothetical protein [Sphingomonas spermidinifaciens]PCD03745.1 hypothetical protein COC42_05185 [Sphingomonas spermidinifaciens]
MIRKPLVLLSLSMLAACGGGDAGGNLAEGELGPDVAERSYEGDNLTSIDAAANDASIQPLAPDSPLEAPGNDAAGVE